MKIAPLVTIRDLLLSSNRLSGVRKVKIRITQQNFIDSYHELIYRYKEAYTEEHFNNLYNNFKFRLFYIPVIIAEGGYESVSFDYKYEDSYTVETKYKVTEDEYLKTYNEYGSEIASEYKGSTSHYETKYDTHYYWSDASGRLPNGFKTILKHDIYGIDTGYYDCEDLYKSELDKNCVLYDVDSHIDMMAFYHNIDDALKSECESAAIAGCKSSKVIMKGYRFEYQFVSYYICLFPVYEIITFDGKNHYYLNAATSTKIFTSFVYKEQSEYLNPVFKKTRETKRIELCNKINTGFKKSFIFCSIILALLIGLDTYLLVSQLITKFDYVGNVFEFFGKLKSDSTYLAGIIVFSLFIGINFLLFIISIFSSRRSKRRLFSSINNETFVDSKYSESITRIGKKESIGCFIISIIFIFLCLGSSIATIPLSYIGNTKTSEPLTIVINNVKDIENIELYYK